MRTNPVVQVVKHSLMRTVSVFCVLAIIGLIGWCIYVVVIKPQTNPLKNQEQIAESITNIHEIKEEEAIVLSLFPPRAKLGGIDLRLFDFKGKTE